MFILNEICDVLDICCVGKFGICCITETWLNDVIFDHIFFPDCYKVLVLLNITTVQRLLLVVERKFQSLDYFMVSNGKFG
jgi:hypothetical protein